MGIISDPSGCQNPSTICIWVYALKLSAMDSVIVISFYPQISTLKFEEQKFVLGNNLVQMRL